MADVFKFLQDFTEENGRLPYADEVFNAGFIAGAEPREKQIQIDAEQIRALQKQNGELTDMVKELEAQNEKMKCCSNCNHFNKESDIEYCQNCERQLVNSLDNFPREEIIKDEWELRR